jgi:predicted amidohydrolase YtcJ
MKPYIAGFLTFILCLPMAQANMTADYVLYNGVIFTVNPQQKWADTIAFKNGEIIYVGSELTDNQLINEQTRLINLNKKLVLPGFHDSHIHPISSVLNSYMCSLFELNSIEAYKKKIKDCVATHQTAEWIHGAGWGHSIFSENYPPDRFMLDAISPDIPLTLSSYDGHSLWANSKAIKLASINQHTPNVKSGEIVRLPDGNPSGLFLEDEAQELVMRAKPAYNKEQLHDALIYVQKYLNSLGITSVQDALVDTADNSLYESYATYNEADQLGELTLRVTAALYWDPTKSTNLIEKITRMRVQAHNNFFQANSVKIWQDGVMHTRTAALIEDYHDLPEHKGMATLDQTTLNDLTTELDKLGFQVHFHADGDRAVRQSLNAIEAAQVRNGQNDNRHHIAHIELIHPEDIKRFKLLQVTANLQPLWSTSETYIADLLSNKLGEHRKAWLELNKSFINAGARVAYGSDWFVTSANPMDILEAAVTRIQPSQPYAEKKQRTPHLPKEAVDLETAITSYTINGAYINHQDTLLGSLEVGKLADLIILDQNIFELDPLRISDTKVIATFVNGKPVFGDLNNIEPTLKPSTVP